MDVLKESLNEVSLRRTKDLLDLPAKNIINETIELSSVQRQFYDDIVNGITSQANLVNIDNTNLLSMISRLR
uniref:ATP-dependent helicase n=1 Tax=Siphoviridae sp. ctiOl67 TaxID=2825622 RepID=A0A8S5QKC0_9CAUD|nr:MAG TPA: ATP-dependent helicase [Siphoviridae sp. ctiOl67]